jgi:hypothetical protein
MKIKVRLVLIAGAIARVEGGSARSLGGTAGLTLRPVWAAALHAT